jgi:hypothetical protein
MLLASWGVLAAVVLVLAVYRGRLGRHEDDTIHINDQEAALVSAQAQAAHRIDVIERWGKSLTVLLVLYGLCIGAYYLYNLWEMQNTTIMMN